MEDEHSCELKKVNNISESCKSIKKVLDSEYISSSSSSKNIEEESEAHEKEETNSESKVFSEIKIENVIVNSELLSSTHDYRNEKKESVEEKDIVEEDLKDRENKAQNSENEANEPTDMDEITELESYGVDNIEEKSGGHEKNETKSEGKKSSEIKIDNVIVNSELVLNKQNYKNEKQDSVEKKDIIEVNLKESESKTQNSENEVNEPNNLGIETEIESNIIDNIEGESGAHDKKETNSERETFSEIKIENIIVNSEYLLNTQNYKNEEKASIEKRDIVEEDLNESEKRAQNSEKEANELNDLGNTTEIDSNIVDNIETKSGAHEKKETNSESKTYLEIKNENVVVNRELFLNTQNYKNEEKASVEKKVMIEDLSESENVTYNSENKGNKPNGLDDITEIESLITSHKSNLCEYDSFNREIYMYSIVFPALNQFAFKKLDNPLENIVRPYHFYDGNLILDKLENKNFKIWSRIQSMDLHHIILVLTTLGKFHGIVMAFREQRPTEFNLLSTKLYNVMSNYFNANGILRTIQSNFDRVLNALEDLGRIELVQKYERMKDVIENILVLDDSEKPIIAMHADFWVDNIIFEYEKADSHTPCKMFLDNFQLSMMDSPVRDISYLIYCYCSRDILEELDFLLHVYHVALSNTVSSLGCDSDQIYSLQTLKVEWRRYGLYGLLMSLLELMDDCENIGEHKEIPKINDEQILDQRIVENFIHFADKFL